MAFRRLYFTRVVREDTARKGLLYAGTEYGLFISLDDGARWQPFQLNLPITPVTDLRVYRDNLIVTTQGRGFYVLESLAIPRTIRPGIQQANAILFKPDDGYRTGSSFGPIVAPKFEYWFKDAPTSPVTVTVSDAKGNVVFTVTTQPGGERRRGWPAGGAGAGAGCRCWCRCWWLAVVVLLLVLLLGGGGGGGRGGRGGQGGPGPGGTATAVQGMNRASWTNLRLPSPYTVPPGIVMWGGGPGPAQGPRVAPGVYTVKVSSGAWSESQTFRLKPDPRYTPAMTEAEGAEQLRMAQEIGGEIKALYDNLAKIRDTKKQAAEMAQKGGAGSAIAAAANTLKQKLEAVEGDITQMQGEGGQDALNFPGRLDNQMIALYQGITSAERRMGTPVTERYKDLKPEADGVLKRAENSLKVDVAAFNAVATKAGLQAIIVK